MNDKLKDLILFMFRHRIIGAKHFPEEKLIKSRIKYLDKNSQKQFYDEYYALVDSNYFIRLKKRTGKGSEEHISMNPEMIEDIYELLEDEHEQ